MVTFLTPVVPYFTPHVATGFESLFSRMASETGFAYGVIDD